jgi:hypothetical protein
VNDTLSTPDPATQVAEVREIIRGRGDHSCEAVLIRIRRVVDPPADPGPLEHDERRWPILGTAWERHDDPDVTQ